MSDKTFGELFWNNVDKMLEENKKGLKDISRFLESDHKKADNLYHRLHRSRSEGTNPSNIMGQGIYNYFKRFDEFLTVGFLYDELDEE
ncbi:hypothetical protein HZR21_08575 [Lactococcus laudensis]|uniref:Uncharacterized protein n=1 Tax=Pseudolactococcus laudensis TaxID=1494461 RepID=A0A7V8N200_9LACT|nr:hypothetical protein [Lactococcus laudensis]MBA0017171.1 hypothetical protein [Lactococcus laudensis]MBW9281895.1 hypothetical protein [Lactococcus laudensis]